MYFYCERSLIIQYVEKLLADQSLFAVGDGFPEIFFLSK
tara:strand:- start:1527 stop:1643 length:117 start_codon:yes stop_codon:yes gene_type:complete